MTRKDYDMLASAIRETSSLVIPGGPHRMHADSALVNLANRLSDQFEEENPRFDRARFLEACGFPMPTADQGA